MNFAVIGSSSSSKNKAHPPSAAQYFSISNYSGSRQALIRIPQGYFDNSNSYPLMIGLPGYGATDRTGGSFANVNNSGEGFGQFLLANASPQFERALWIIPENLVFNVDYSSSEFVAAKAYMTTHYRVDTNRISITGLSGGAIGCLSAFINNQSEIASMTFVSGPAIDSAWSTASGIGIWHHQGTADATFGRTIGGTLYRANGGSGAFNNLDPAARTSYYYPLGHTSSVWDTNVYNPSTAPHDVYAWMLKFSKDTSQQATLHVEFAESSLDVRDYREALIQVNNLSSGSTKTALLSRLSTLRTTIDKGGSRYFISFQDSSIGSLGSGYNIFVSPLTTNAAITNIVDQDNSSSTIGVKIQQQLDVSGTAEAVSSFNAGRQKSKGFVYQANLQGALVNASLTNGVVRLTNIPTGKLVDVLIHRHHNFNDDDNNAMSSETKLQATVNGITNSQYSAYNNVDYLYFTGAPESSGNVDIAIRNAGARSAAVQMLEILVY